MPHLMSRADWGAAKPAGATRLAAANIRGLGVHYSAADADEQADHARCPGRVRSIQRFHMEGRGWDDIAYSWLTCRHGGVFEGRGLGVRTAANGTNTGNAHYLAVCFLGDDTAGRDDVTDAGRLALRHVVDLVRREYPHAREVHPHSHFKATSCPGDELRAWITAGLPTTGLVQPTPGSPSPPPAVGQVETAGKILRSGARGPRVRQVQHLLTDRGQNPGPHDGVYGFRTEQAVKAHQGRVGVATDGVVGPVTWATLRGPRLLRRGDRSLTVGVLQELLTAAGVPAVSDGVFGPATEQAVRGFQARRGLSVDGLVGTATWAALW